MIPHDSKLEFCHETHTYWHPRAGVCKSVTTIIKQFSKTFDEDGYAARVAEREGTNAQVIKDRWRAKRDGATSLGTYVHAVAEDTVINSAGKMQVVINLPMDPVPQVSALYKWFAHRLEIFYGQCQAEHRIVWPQYAVAGTIDLIAWNYGGGPALIDYKTNEEISVYGYNNMLPPFQRGKHKMQDSALSHYTLQLNAYRLILKEHYGYTFDKLVLVHLDKYGEFHEYEIPVKEDHAKLLLGVTHAEDTDDGCGLGSMSGELPIGGPLPEACEPAEWQGI